MNKRFWKFVDCVNWNQYCIDHNKKYDAEGIVLNEIATTFTWDEFSMFEEVYDNLYHELFSKFHNIWLSDVYTFMPSDDGYTDLISSIIGKGYDFYYNVTDDDFIEMARSGNYRENFGYLFPYTTDKESSFMKSYKASYRNNNIDKVL